MIFHKQQVTAVCDMCDQTVILHDVKIPNGQEFYKANGLPDGWSDLNGRLICDNHDIIIDGYRYDCTIAGNLNTIAILKEASNDTR